MDIYWVKWAGVVGTAGLAGAVNAVAGGGTFLTFPALTGLGGLTEKVANMTSTVGLWPGSASSVVAASHEIRRLPRGLVLGYAGVSLIGGAAGAMLLVSTTDRDFRLVIPWLLAFATVVFAFSKRIARWAGRKHGHRTWPWTAAIGAAQFIIALYGGYFGAGIGVLMLAGLSLTGLEDIHQMNALKVLLATVINAAAVVLFVATWGAGGQSIAWQYGPAMMGASAVGGFTGMRLSRRVPQPVLRAVVLTIGVALTGYYFWKGYG